MVGIVDQKLVVGMQILEGDGFLIQLQVSSRLLE